MGIISPFLFFILEKNNLETRKDDNHGNTNN